MPRRKRPEKNEQGTEQCLVREGLAPIPGLDSLHQFAERKELGDLFAVSSVNQVARVGISSNVDFITIFSLAPGFTLKVKLGWGRGEQLL